METDRLRAFCTIVDTGSMTKAAEVLGVSHSGLSKSISALQAELGFKVFKPQGRGLELTADGKDLYGRSRDILNLVNALKIKTPPTRRPVQIGFPEVLALASAESLMHAFPEGVRLEDLDSGEIESEVAEGRMDFAFTFVPLPRPDIEHLKITAVTLRSFARAGKFKNEAPEKIPYVVPVAELKDNPLSLKVRDGWNPNLDRFAPFHANSLGIALNMVQSGLCAVYAASFLIRHLNETSSAARTLVELDLPAPRKAKEKSLRDIFLVKRKIDDEDKAMKIAVKIVRQACRD